MLFIKKYRIEILVFTLLILSFFLLRIYNILSLPIFTDEAIYVRWAQIAKQDANWRFISLTDGKQPMFVWLTMVSMRFIEEPLLAGRLVSVTAGFFTLIGLFFLGWELFRNKWIGILSSFLYAIYPMALVYDRMALYDSLVGTFAVWSLYFAILLARRIRLDTALILGMVIGGGVLTKTSGFFSIYLLPVTLLLFDFSHKDRFKRLTKWIGLTILATTLAYMFYSILRLSPFFHIINEKNALFVYPLREWIDHPFTFFVGNWKAIWDWLTRYMTWTVLLLVGGSFFITRSKIKEKLLILGWFLISAIGLAIFGKTLYPRFVFFMTLFLIPLAAFSLFNIYLAVRNKLLLIVLFLIIFSLAFRTDYLILNDFSQASIPRSDLSQYKNDWPSGGGVKEAVEFFKEQAQKGKIYIVTQGTFGLLPFAFEIYLVDNPNVAIEGFWPVGDYAPQKVLEKSKQMPTFFVFYQPCPSQCPSIGEAPSAWKELELVYQFSKDYGKRHLSVYKVRP
ncbi:MAG: glycosyltransferase family 39 protein [Patescibacteria group bacterium]